MVFQSESASSFNSGLSLPELCDALSPETIHSTGVKTGVLLYVCTPGFTCDHCKQCWEERLACVYTAAGNIVHNTGDVILAEWVVDEVLISYTISRAAQCAFKILDAWSIQSRVHDLSHVPIKIVISAGRFSKVRQGDETSRVSVVTGPVVDELRSAAVLAEHGTIVLSPEAWDLYAYDDFTDLTVQCVGDEGAVKVHYISQQKTVSVKTQSHSNSSNHLSKFSRLPQTAYLLTTAERENITRQFTMQTAMDKTKDNLQEIWPVTIMCINLQFEQTQMDLSGSHDKLKEIIAKQMLSCHGEICNVSVETSCAFLCVVGLPDDKRQHEEDKTARALQAAHQIHETCRQEINSLSSISVGVTTGRVLYDLQQTSMENKCKVYGDKVNLAAKLSTDYPGIVSCDVATKLYSMLPYSQLMPKGEISQHEEVCYQDDVDQMLADEAALSSTEMYGRRLALAHMQTMVPDEERMVKYASVIGHTFTLDLLRNVLPDMSEQALITTLKALFGAGIFKCASSSETCKCNKNSPKVLMEPEWTCQLMSFCNKDEMEMVHALMERNEHYFQEINAECANHLEKKAYRCGKCKDKRFVFGQKADRGSNDEHILTISQSQDDLCQNQMNPAEGNGIDVENFLAKAQAVLTEARDRMTAGSCECDHLVEIVLFSRLRYWRCLGDVPRTFYYLMESASACVYLQQDARALEYLTEARSILENLKEGKPAFPSAEPGDVQICQIQQAFVYRLTGEILFKAGKIVEAEENFKTALTVLHCSLPRNAVARSFKLISEKMKRLHFRCRQFKFPQNSEQARVQECIECLSFLWQIGCMRGQLRKASLAITMEINLAIQSGDPFKILYCTIDYLKYKQFKCKGSKESLEAFLCKTCARLLNHPEGQKQMSDLARTLAVINPCVGSV